jgi:16S rRNA (uracil1498-N3)-methyltransferase
VDRSRRAIATFFTDETPHRDRSIELGSDAANHARVRRLGVGDRVRLLDGRGSVALGAIEEMGRSAVRVAVGEVTITTPPPPLELAMPVADRDRMLWLVEKATELGATGIHPVLYSRSRSVGGRGEGSAFAAKLVARMRSAMEQSGNPWLPSLGATVEPADLARFAGGNRLLLDGTGSSLLAVAGLEGHTVFALGPEGGFEAEEVELLTGSGWCPVALGANVLRFETAGVAALAVAAAARLGEIDRS